MDLNMRTIRYFERILEGNAVKEESADIIVPDMYPDILRIVDTSGLAVIKEKSARDDRTEVFGVVKANVLYVPEGEQGLKKLDVSLPFSHVFEGRGITPESRIMARAVLLSAETHPINPRKVQVSVSVQLDLTVFSAADWDVCEGVAEARENSVQLLKSVQCAYMPIAVKDKSFVVSDEIEAPGSRPPILEILKADVRLITQEVKPIGKKLLFKGAAFMRVLYQGPPGAHPADGIGVLEQEVPFSQIIEMEDAEDECDCAVSVQLAGLDLDLRTGLSGEARVLGVSLQLDAQAVGFMQRNLEAVVDLYSTAFETVPEFRTYHASQLLDKSVHRQSVRESCETGQPVGSVIDAQVFLWPVTQTREEEYIELSTEAMVKVVYLGDDQQFYSMMRRVPVSCKLEAAADVECRATAAVTGEILATGTHEGVELRFSVDFDVMLSSVGQFTAIGAVSLDMQAPRDSSGQPSVVLRRSQLGESLWQIAKKYNTTTGGIALANQLDESEALEAGKLLLIPRHR